MEEPQEEKQTIVVSSMEKENKNNYYLTFKDQTITSRMISKLLINEKVEIKKVYPAHDQLVIVDSVIEEKLNSFYYIDEETLEEEYIEILKDYGLDEDILEVKQRGILIDKVYVNTDYETLTVLRRSFPNLLYSYQLDGFYQ